jgi:hypothetical protein
VAVTGDVRTVLGLSAEAWCLLAFLGVVVTICATELGRYLAHVSAAYKDAPPDDRPSSLPASRVEAAKARTGVWR